MGCHISILSDHWVTLDYSLVLVHHLFYALGGDGTEVDN